MYDVCVLLESSGSRFERLLESVISFWLTPESIKHRNIPSPVELCLEAGLCRVLCRSRFIVEPMREFGVLLRELLHLLF